MAFEKFHYKSVKEIEEKAKQLGTYLPFAKNTKALTESISFGNVTLPNRMGVAPMEGADANADGSPSELTERRYMRAAMGGSGIVWYEAVSVAKEGRSSAHQLYISEDNADSFKRLNEKIKEECIKKNGYAPMLIMQANHSGRYSNPEGRPAPLIAYRNPIYERLRAADDSCIVSDDYLKQMEERFGASAELARKGGFDAVDIKSCHGYLFMEVLSGYTRTGEYGGSFDNRKKLLINSIKAAKTHETKDFTVTARIGIYDGFEYPYGFGVREGQGDIPCYDEAKALIKEIYGLGVPMVNLTMGNPYVDSHVTRPFNVGKYVPEENPIYGVGRMINGIREVKESVPGMKIYASGPSFIREYSDLYAAGAIEEGFCDGMLFGRMSFADPEFANQIIKEGRIDAKNVCLACGKCGDLIRAGKHTGCVIRDAEIYMPQYREFQQGIVENHV